MPIYAYRCEHCAFQQDVLQKMSDPLLVTCPSCGEPAFRKQVTAAGFQLKGSGWYVTDFRNPAATKDAKGDGASQDAARKADAGPSEAKSGAAESASESAAASPAPTTEPKPAAAASKPAAPAAGST